MRSRRSTVRQWMGATATAVVVALSAAGCASTTTTRVPVVQPTRARAFVDTFDRILVAGFLADRVSDRGHDLDINDETSRLLRMPLRAKGSFDVIEPAAGVATPGRGWGNCRRASAGGCAVLDAPWRGVSRATDRDGHCRVHAHWAAVRGTHDGPPHRAPLASSVQARAAIGVHQRSHRRGVGFGAVRPIDGTRVRWTHVGAGSVLPADGQA